MSVLLLGNGINLQEKLTPKWDSLLADIAKDYHVKSGKSLSMTLGYEMLENQILSKNAGLQESEIHKRIAACVDTDAMKKKKDWSGTVHAKLTALPVDAILTTNYDYAIERSIDPSFRKSYNTRETTYSLQRYQKSGGKTVYHIHGECGYPKSICLGFEQYAGSLQRIRERIVQNTAVDKTAKEQGYTFLLADIFKGITQKPEYSWYYDFFLKDVYILGLTLDVSEMDLWWLLSYRSKLLATNKLLLRNKIYYLDVSLADEKKTHEYKRRQKLLKVFHVEWIQSKGESYTEQYDFACNWLKKHVK